MHIHNSYARTAFSALNAQSEAKKEATFQQALHMVEETNETYSLDFAQESRQEKELEFLANSSISFHDTHKEDITSAPLFSAYA